MYSCDQKDYKYAQEDGIYDFRVVDFSNILIQYSFRDIFRLIKILEFIRDHF